MAIIGVTSGQMMSLGKCPDVPSKRSFDINKYAGTWYEQKSYPTVWYMSSTSCLSSSITIVDDGSIQMTRSGVDGKSMVTNGTAWRNERQDYQTSLQDHAYLRDQQRTSHTYIE
ncbi:apolipoprotein D-like isoform X3 [Ylistrum balloti]|uniref:apolipoprotein D-like isoform X3 n=1 Tax=Ylistrum balloti TaxID=509963 RepID=UPI002905801C|nr:apolipoprotein D-like isoform X3 [Ylistrum balloti]